jgi:hypothetical protein
MSDPIFFVGAMDKSRKLTGYVPAKFLILDGQPVVDPMPGGSQNAYVYSDDRGGTPTRGAFANPNNYLIVPANFSERQARAYAARIADLQKLPAIGAALALGRLAVDFRPGGSQDLQRHPQWGVPEGAIAPAFIGSASHYLGFVNGLTGIPLKYSELGGGITNGGPDKSGPYGVSQHNHRNLVEGLSEAAIKRHPPWLTNDFGYDSQGQTAVGQIGAGRGIANWVSSLHGIVPSSPTEPALPQKTAGPLGIVTNEPTPDWPVPPPIFRTR